MKNKLTIGTRSSKLALYQSNLVKTRLEELYPEITFELLNIKTKGDIMIDKVLDRNIDKGFFVSEIQNMLVKNEIDIAVHSLKDLPVDVVKLDKMFTSGIEDPVTGNLISFVVEVCQKLSMEMIGEGIETEQQKQAMIDLGCPIGQGFLMHKPEFLNTFKE